MKIQSFDQAVEYLFGFIPTVAAKEFQGEIGLQRQKLLMQHLNNPQEKLPVIHIAGTSGKGSTSYLTSTALISQGFKVGLHLSPHLLDIRERTSINNEYLSEDRFVQYLNEMMPAIEQVSVSELGSPTYFEILVALAYYSFWKEKVNFAVMETGLGGLYDGTNVVENPSKIAVITQIGLDHTNILGDTYAKIAAQKAGIIHPGNTVVTVEQEPSAHEVIEKTAEQKGATIYFVQKDREYSQVDVLPTATSFEFSFQGLKLSVQVGLLGEHQAQNSALALGTLVIASKQYAFDIDVSALQKHLSSAHFLGRMDIRSVHGKTFIMDGAHNPQKMQSFLRALTSLYPNQKFQFLLAFKKGKDSEQMLEQIVPIATHITFSSFFTNRQDMPHFSQVPHELAELVKERGVGTSVTNSPEEGLKEALNSSVDTVVATGSLYFLSELYRLLPNV